MCTHLQEPTDRITFLSGTAISLMISELCVDTITQPRKCTFFMPSHIQRRIPVTLSSHIHFFESKTTPVNERLEGRVAA